MATPSYRERMKAARAEASAQRKAQQYAELRQRELVYEVRKLAMEAVVAGIKGRGDRVQVYSRAQLTAMANASISAFLIEQARARIASRTGHILGQSATTAPRYRSIATLSVFGLAAVVAFRYPLVGLGMCILCLIVYLKPEDIVP